MSNRPMLNLWTDALVERIACGDAAARREAHLRLADGVMARNERKLRSALGLEASAPAPAPVVAPASAPESEFSPEVILAACALLLADQGTQVSTPDPAPAPAPAPSPKAARKTRQASAATVFNKRVYALAKDGERVRLATRATKLAKRDGLSREFVDALSDDQCLALVAEPIA